MDREGGRWTIDSMGPNGRAVQENMAMTMKMMMEILTNGNNDQA